MFKETFERGPGETQEKSDLTKKVEQLSLMRKKEALLKEQIKVPVIPSEAAKVLKEYRDTLELLTLIETDLNTLKEAERSRLTTKFEKPIATAANDEDAFDAALRQTGESQAADRLDARRKAA
jgi:hypothetical protein